MQPNDVTGLDVRPESLPSETFNLLTAHGRIYAVVSFKKNKDDSPDYSVPLELFLYLGQKDQETKVMLEALGRVIGLGWRRGVITQEFINQLSGLTCDHVLLAHETIYSVPDGVSKILRHLLEFQKEHGISL